MEMMLKPFNHTCILAASLLLAACAGGPEPYKDSSRSSEERTADLLS